MFNNEKQNNRISLPQYIIDKNIDVNIFQLKEVFKNNEDIIFRELVISKDKQIRGFICFINGLTNREEENEHIIKPLMMTNFSSYENVSDDLELLRKSILNVGQIE